MTSILPDRLHHTSLATKIAILGLITTVVTLLAGLIGLSYLYVRYRAGEADLYRSRRTRIEFALSSLKKEQRNFVHDYGIWNEMADNVLVQDTTWLMGAFGGSHQTFNTDVATVYTAEDRFLVQALADPDTRTPAASALLEAAARIQHANDESHLVIPDTDGTLWHIMGGAIGYHTDPTASVAGKIVVARRYDAEEFDYMAQLLDATVTLTSTPIPSGRSTADEIHVSEPNASAEQPITYIAAFSNRTLYFLWDSLRIFLLVTLLSGFILIVLSHRLEYLLILNPITRLTDKLRSQSLLAAHPHECPNEIEMLDQLIDSYLVQGAHLQKLSRIVEESTNAVALADLSGNLTYVNPSWERLNGYMSSEVIGKNPRILKSGKTPEQLYTRMWDTLLSGKPFLSREFINKRKDGSEYFCYLSVFPILEAGKINAFAAILQDISQEKEVDRMKTEFISMASHQLRTPLSAMRWFGELLLAGKGGELNDKQKEMIGNLQTSTMRMIALVNALLDITRLESGRIIIEPEPTDLDELVRSLLVELTPRIEAKKLTLHADIPEDLPIINLDKKMIREVYANLLTNAIKYTPEGGSITITVRDAADHILSTVKDTGLGIPIAEQNKVFTKFYRGSNVMRVETDGTGLGLYLIKAIVESSGGKIWFESVISQGTTFSFTIPKSGMVKKSGSVTIGS